MKVPTAKISKSWIERTLARGIADVASEMRLVDLGNLVEMIQSDRATNIADFVNSSTELYFRPGTLRYGLLANIDIRWETRPTVLLDMEFRNASVTVFFKMTLGHAFAGVEVFDAHFEDEHLTSDGQTLCLTRAIEDARLVRGGRPAR